MSASAKEAFGVNLRRARLKKGVALDKIARDTRIGIEHLEALERNDFTYWPRGIYARSWIRSYAQSVGVDPESTVDDFCRWFPNGDRRSDRVLRETSGLIGHDFEAHPELVGTEQDRRGGLPDKVTGSWVGWVTGRLSAWRRVPSRRAGQEAG